MYLAQFVKVSLFSVILSVRVWLAVCLVLICLYLCLYYIVPFARIWHGYFPSMFSVLGVCERIIGYFLLLPQESSSYRQTQFFPLDSGYSRLLHFHVNTWLCNMHEPYQTRIAACQDSVTGGGDTSNPSLATSHHAQTRPYSSKRLIVLVTR